MRSPARTKKRLSPDALTRVRRLPERGVYDLEAIHAVLDAATHCHIAHVVEGRPVATPTLHWRIGEIVYWHGSIASRMVRRSVGAQVCLTATLFDGWVLARSAFNHSALYRSVMLFGRPVPVEDPAEKQRLLQAFTDHWFPGRWARLRPVKRQELAATQVLSMPIERAAAKIRDGGADDPARDRQWPVWAGVVPIRQRYGRRIAETDSAAEPPGRVRPLG